MMHRWTRAAATAPGVGLSLLPKLACPACWPAYAGLLSSVGLGFLISTAYLFPLTIAFLLLALSAIAFRAKSRRGYWPLILGVFASAGVVIGKFVWESGPVMYGAVGLLIAASIWNAWLQPSVTPNPAREACEGGLSAKLGNPN